MLRQHSKIVGTPEPQLRIAQMKKYAKTQSSIIVDKSEH